MKFEIIGTAFEIEIEPDGCVYTVDGVKVSRDDYLAILATFRTESLNGLAEAFDRENPVGIAGWIQAIAEQLNPEEDKTLADQMLRKLMSIAEAAER